MSTTLPSGALSGFADGAAYDQHRPSYPPAAVASLLAHMRLAALPAARIVDVAAGTGKFTELLAARPERFRLAAVEPHAGMRAELARKRLAGVDVVADGLAARLPLADAWADGVVCAQSFHWFSTLGALASMARVLRPGAALGLVWNVEDYNNTPALRFRNETWRRVFAAGAGAERFFGPLAEERFAWTTFVDEEGLWARFRTLSQIAALEGAKLAAARKLFDEAIAGPGTEWDAQGRLAVRGITLIAWTQRAPQPTDVSR
jgi:SAM-dependent methyltransferase